jgi:peptidoglycan biosynthesis protein MviN/MurJ (putative lipid II flippase)
VISGANLAFTAIAALALYGPFGVGGIVASTAIATGASVIAQCMVLRSELGGLELPRLADSALRIGVGSAALAGVSYVVWELLDSALGRSLGAQAFSLSAGLLVGGAVYLGVTWILRVPELEQILRLLRRR